MAVVRIFVGLVNVLGILLGLLVRVHVVSTFTLTYLCWFIRIRFVSRIVGCVRVRVVVVMLSMIPLCRDR